MPLLFGEQQEEFGEFLRMPGHSSALSPQLWGLGKVDGVGFLGRGTGVEKVQLFLGVPWRCTGRWHGNLADMLEVAPGFHWIGNGSHDSHFATAISAGVYIDLEGPREQFSPIETDLRSGFFRFSVEAFFGVGSQHDLFPVGGCWGETATPSHQSGSGRWD